MPKAFTANFSDLAGPTNPAGIWSPAFLALKIALDKGDTPDNVLQALYDWLSQKRIAPSQVERILKLEPDKALDALVGLVGGALKPQALPPLARQTLERTVRYIAQRAIDRQQAEVTSLRQRYGVESAPRLVQRLLNCDE